MNEEKKEGEKEEEKQRRLEQDWKLEGNLKNKSSEGGRVILW